MSRPRTERAMGVIGKGAFAVVSIGICFIAPGWAWAQDPPKSVPRAGASVAAELSKTYEEVAKALKPSVVTITSMKIVKPRPSR